jgi:hypothetical protein
LAYQRFGFFVFVTFCLLLISAKFLFLGAIGIGAKSLLFFNHKSTLSYDYIGWKSGEIVFYNSLIQKKGEYAIETPQIRVDLSLKHLIFHHPRITIDRVLLTSGSSSEWTIELKEGELSIPGMDSLAISFERNWEHQIGRLKISSKESSCEMEAISEGLLTRIQMTCCQMDVAWISQLLDHCRGDFSSWLESCKGMRGKVDGSAHLAWDGSLFHKGSAHFLLQDGGYLDYLDHFQGVVDWEGPFSLQMLQTGFLKIQAEKGSLKWRDSSIQKMEGEFCLIGGIGAKWSFQAHDEGINLEGKAILSQEKERWFESTIGWTGGNIQFHGDELGDDYLIHAEGDEIGSLSLFENLELFCGKIKGNFASKTNVLELHCTDASFQKEGRVLLQEGDLLLSGTLGGGQWVVETIQGASPAIAFEGSGWIDSHFMFACEMKSMEIGDGLLFQFYDLPFSPLKEGRFILQKDGFHAYGSLFSPHCSMRILQDLSMIDPTWNTSILASIDATENRVEFDVSLEGALISWARLSGSLEGNRLFFDPEKSHLIGKSLTLKKEENRLICDTSISKIGFDALKAPSWLQQIIGETTPCYMMFSFETCLCDLSFIAGDVSLQGTLHWGDSGWSFMNGQGRWGNLFESTFQGKGNKWDTFEVEIEKAHLKFQEPLSKMEVSTDCSGLLSGSFQSKIDLDLDLFLSDLHINQLSFESREELHLHYGINEGVLLYGIDFVTENSPFYCKMDLLKIDPSFSSISLSDLYLHIQYDEQWPHLFPSNHGWIDFSGDLRLFPHLQAIEGDLKKASIPCFEESIQITDGTFALNRLGGDISFSYLHHDEKIPMTIGFNTNPMRGTLIIRDEVQQLFVNWNYQDRFFIEKIQGGLKGFDAAFYPEKEGQTLVGRFSFDCRAIEKFVPPPVQELFHDLEMGEGYTFKGSVGFSSADVSDWFFSGILSGKDFELFGFQFRTLFSKIAVTPTRCEISELHIQDLAGEIKIEKILANEDPNSLWMLDLPLLQISELRPAFLRKPGEILKKDSPLVVRSMEIRDLKGELENTSTYTAKGELTFINSYRREHTVFDLPSDFLSRIFGLDLELLIPVRGKLSYELKDRLFQVTEMVDAYSAAERSLFFLVPSIPLQGVDLDGNIRGVIQMKHFVLFPFTESFWITIKGDLENPKFQLQRKNFHEKIDS